MKDVTGDRQMLRKLAHSSLRQRLEARNSLSEVFHENTKLGPLTSRAYATWIFNLNRSRVAQQRMHQGFKAYTLMERRDLPQVEARTELERTITARRSIRAFSGAAMGIEKLARLLFFTYGTTDPGGVFRAVASGGALYPLELYVVAFKIEGLDQGIYHYGVETGHLDVVKPGESLVAFKDVVNWQGVDIDNACLAIVITAAFRRSTVKYLDRGYRMVLMEAGEAAQNLCLVAAAMDLGACLLGGFNDDWLSNLLDIDGVEEAPLLPVLVGGRRQEAGSGDERERRRDVDTFASTMPGANDRGLAVSAAECATETARGYLMSSASSTPRASMASEPRERSEPAKRRARERVGESEGRKPLGSDR